jgi:hypothetical protein
MGKLMDPECPEVFDSERLLEFARWKLDASRPRPAGGAAAGPRHMGRIAPRPRSVFDPGHQAAGKSGQVAPEEADATRRMLADREERGELRDLLGLLVGALLQHRRPNDKEKLEHRTPKGLMEDDK